MVRRGRGRRGAGRLRTVIADHDVSAMPVEHARGTSGPALRPADALSAADDPDAERCEIWELFRPPEPEPFKRVDELRYRPALPNT